MRTIEQERNEILRRADWRFLLPNPAPARTLCLATGSLQRAVEAISRETTARTQPGTCDLAVASNPTRKTLRYMWNALAPGGVIYVEWAMVFFTLGIMRRELRACGFQEIALYWAYPFPSRAPAAFWLPLESRSALRYFAAQPRPNQTPGRSLLRGLGMLAAKVGWILPVSAIARKPVGRAMYGPGQTRVSHLQPREQGWGGSRAAWSWLLLTPGQRSNNKAVALGFDGQNAEPQVALKFARVREAIPALRREEQNLNALAACTHGRVRGVPRILSFQEQGETAALGETVLTGIPLYNLLNRETFRPLAQQATGWLVELAQGSASPALSAEWRTRIVEPILAEFQEGFGIVMSSAHRERIRAQLAQLELTKLVFEQRDFSPWNVLLDAKRNPVVLDWESAEPSGIPGLDLIYFLTYLAFFFEGAMESRRFLETYRTLLNPATFTGRVFADCTAQYAAQVGISAEDWPRLRLLVWMLHARSEHARLSADAGGEPTADQLRTSIFFRLVSEELDRVG